MSFQVTNTKSINNSIKNALLTSPSTLAGIFFLETASYPKNNKRPPSKAGIGSKFISPILTDKNPIKANKFKNPPAAALETKLNIPTGPAKSPTPTPLDGLNNIPNV